MTQSNIDALHREFGIPNVVAVIAGNGGLPKIRVTAPAASAEIYLHGAHVAAWQPAGEKEVLFVSEKSSWQDGKAIRGGIPICFPWFRAKADDPKAPSHGFVRTKEWQLESVKQEGESVVVLCSTESDESTRAWWPHSFRAVHRVSIGKSLRLQLRVTNTGDAPFHFEEALHTYFRVSQSSKIRVHGLDRIAYLDNVDGNKEKTQSGDIVFTAKTDNAYIDALGTAEVMDEDWGRILRTEKENSATTVVWNPSQDGAAAIADLGGDEWRQFACVEASNILSRAVSLAPGKEHTMHSTLSVVPIGKAR
jgi:D-hexose-6-phosphate mutarotase